MLPHPSTVHIYNPQVPFYNGTIQEAIAAGGFPLHVERQTIVVLAKFFENIFGPSMLMFQDFMMTNLPTFTLFLKKWADENVHTLTKQMPLTDPIDVIYCVLLYFVLLPIFYVIGRMTGKLSLRAFGIFHNGFLAVASLYMGIGFMWDMYALNGLKFWNNSIDASHPISYGVTHMGYIFAISKLYEYIDTFIMVLKHNYRQVSFLHLYHHSSVFVMSFLYYAYSPGGDVTWSGMVNSLIHVVMYIYYLLNLIFRHGPVKEFLQRHKFIITRCQLTQFVFNFVQAVYILFIAGPVNCRTEPLWLNLFYMMSMIALFMNFMIQNQKLAAKRKKEAALKNEKKSQ